MDLLDVYQIHFRTK